MTFSVSLSHIHKELVEKKHFFYVCSSFSSRLDCGKKSSLPLSSGGGESMTSSPLLWEVEGKKNAFLSFKKKTDVLSMQFYLFMCFTHTHTNRHGCILLDGFSAVYAFWSGFFASPFSCECGTTVRLGFFFFRNGKVCFTPYENCFSPVTKAKSFFVSTRKNKSNHEK